MFLKEGKTNWKYILIVVILAVIVGGGILGYQWWVAGQETICSKIRAQNKTMLSELDIIKSQLEEFRSKNEILSLQLTESRSQNEILLSQLNESKSQNEELISQLGEIQNTLEIVCPKNINISDVLEIKDLSLYANGLIKFKLKNVGKIVEPIEIWRERLICEQIGEPLKFGHVEYSCSFKSSKDILCNNQRLSPDEETECSYIESYAQGKDFYLIDKFNICFLGGQLGNQACRYIENLCVRK